MKSLLRCTCGAQYKNEAFLLLRVVTGLAFFYHGYDKVFVTGVPNVVQFFSTQGIPLASGAAYLVAYGELIGGLALMAGLFTHWVAKFNVLIMLGAIAFVHWGAEGGWFWGYGADGGYEYQLLLLAVSIFFVIMGSGKYSLDRMLKQKHGVDMPDSHHTPLT